MIATWRSDLNRILLVFNVHFVTSVWPSLTVCFKAELAVDIHVVVPETNTTVSVVHPGVVNANATISDVHHTVVSQEEYDSPQQSLTVA